MVTSADRPGAVRPRTRPGPACGTLIFHRATILIMTDSAQRLAMLFKQLRALAAGALLPIPVLERCARVLSADIDVRLDLSREERAELRKLLALPHPVQDGSDSLLVVFEAMIARCVSLGVLSPAQQLGVLALKAEAARCAADDDVCTDGDEADEWTLVSDNSSWVATGDDNILQTEEQPRVSPDTLAAKLAPHLSDEVITALLAEVAAGGAGTEGVICHLPRLESSASCFQAAGLDGYGTVGTRPGLYTLRFSIARADDSAEAGLPAGQLVLGVNVHAPPGATRRDELVLGEVCTAVAASLPLATALETIVSLVTAHYEAGRLTAIGGAVPQPTLSLSADEEWAELRPYKSNKQYLPNVTTEPVRAFLPTDIKRVAMAQLAMRLTPIGVHVLRVESVLSAKLFEDFQRCHEAMAASWASGPSSCDSRDSAPPTWDECPLAPTLAYHGTPSREALAGILTGGLLAPGEVVASTGRRLPTAHGGRFGDGRYLSQDLETATAYALKDASGKQQVLLCLVAPGWCERLPTDAEERAADGSATMRHHDWHLARCRTCSAPRCSGVECKLWAARAKREEWRKRHEVVDAAMPTLDQLPAATSMADVMRHRAALAAFESKATAGLSEGHLAEAAKLDVAVARLEAEAAMAAALPQYQSRISPDQKQLIVAESSQVLPILLVTFDRDRPDVARPRTARLTPCAAETVRCTMQALDSWAGAMAMAARAAELAASKHARLLTWHSASGGNVTGRGSTAKAARSLMRAAADERARASSEAWAASRRAEVEATGEAEDVDEDEDQKEGKEAGDEDATCRLLAPTTLPRLQPGETSRALRLRTTRPLHAPITVTIIADPADAVSFCPAAVTINPPKPLKPRLEHSSAGVAEETPPPPPPHATFKITAIRALDAPVVVRYQLSGAGAAGVQPAPAGALRIQSCTWAVTVPPDVVELAMGSYSSSSVTLLTVLHGVPDTERAASLAAVGHVLRHVQPQGAALVETAEAAPARVRTTLGRPDRLLSTLESLKTAPLPCPNDFTLRAAAAAKERGTDGLVDGVLTALDLALGKLEKEREERVLQAAACAEAELWHVPLPPLRTRGQQIEKWCRDALLRVVDHATLLGEAGVTKRRRIVDSVTRAHAERLTRCEDSLFLLQIVQYGRARALTGSTAPPSGAGLALPTDVLSVASRRATAAGLKLAVRVLACGKGAEPSTAMAAKAALQTVAAWEPTPLYLAETRKALPVAVRQLCEDVRRCCFATPLTVSVPREARVLHSGLVMQVGQPPVWSASLRLVASEGVSLLFQGVPPRTILLNGRALPARLSGPEKPHETAQEALQRRAFTEPQLLVHMLRLVQQQIGALRVAAGRRGDVLPGVCWLRDLVLTLSASPVEIGGLSATATGISTLNDALTDPSCRALMLRERRRMAADLMGALKEVEETALLAAAATGADGLAAASYLAKPSQLKFGAKVLRRLTRSAAPTIRVPSLLRWLASRERLVGSGERDRGLAPPLPSHKATAERALSLWAELCAYAAAALRQERTAPPGAAALLYSFGMVGVQLRVRRSEAAAINPWAIRIEFLSRSVCDTATALSALDCGHRLLDGTGELAPDVLVLVDPALGTEACAATSTFLQSALHATYLALVFTRSAALRLPAQRTALLVVAFVKGAEQQLRRRAGDRVAEPRMMRQPSHFEMDSSAEDIRLALAILHTLTTMQAHATAAAPELVMHLLGPSPGVCMTEAGDNGVDSVCQLLVLLCLSDELEPLFAPTADAAARRSRVAMALLAEAVSRSCRVLLRTSVANAGSSQGGAAAVEACTGQSAAMLMAHTLVRKALGVTPGSCRDVLADDVGEPEHVEHASEYDVERAVRASGSFFLQAYTNATPFGVVAAVGIAETTREWVAREAPGRTLRSVLADAAASKALAAGLAGAFESRRISMRRFLETHLPGASPQHVQAALYCQGLIYHDSRTRRAGLPPLSRAHDLLAALAADERREVYLARLQQKSARLLALAASQRRNVRLAIARVARAEFLATHEGVPRLFDHAELAQLNATRPAHDQLELVGTSPGLLKHHCAYEGCPHFLRDLRSAKDRAIAAGSGSGVDRRRGLFRHLRWFLSPDRWYTNGMHATALQHLARQPNATRAVFLQQCAHSFEGIVASRNGTGAVQLHQTDLGANFKARTGMTAADLQRLLELIYDQHEARARK